MCEILTSKITFVTSFTPLWQVGPRGPGVRQNGVFPIRLDPSNPQWAIGVGAKIVLFYGQPQKRVKKNEGVNFGSSECLESLLLNGRVVTKVNKVESENTRMWPEERDEGRKGELIPCRVDGSR